MEFSVTKEGYTMKLEVSVIGKDLLVRVTGGNSPHIGSITTLTKDLAPKTVPFPSHDGRFHKDGVLAERIGKIIQSFLPGNCVITSGVHVDQITKRQIMSSDQMASDLGEQLLKWIKQYDFSKKYVQPQYYSKSEKPK